MTNEQALVLIQQAEQCFVTWDTVRNEIIEVRPAGRPSLEALQQSFRGPMDPWHGSSAIMQLLYEQHQDRLSASHLARLEKLLPRRFHKVGNAVLNLCFPRPKLGGARDWVRATRNLECFLCGLKRDPVRLKRVWTETPKFVIPPLCWTGLVQVCGDLRCSDEQIVHALIRTVEWDGMFGPRYEAMVALGKIGKAAGPAASCSRGRVPGGRHTRSCDQCLGIGFVPDPGLREFGGG